MSAKLTPVEMEIYSIASLDLDTMSAQAKADYIVAVGQRLHMTPNQFLQTMKPTIAEVRAASSDAKRDLEFCLAGTVCSVALYKSRQCYRTWIKVR